VSVYNGLNSWEVNVGLGYEYGFLGIYFVDFWVMVLFIV